MSEDERVTKDLIETLKDGATGFSAAAERLADSDRADLSATMRGYSEQRASFAAELDRMAAHYGDDVDQSGSLAARAHRGWMAVKDAITGSSPKGVLDVAEQGEDHAVSEYEDALSKDISGDLRSVVERQSADVKKAHDEIRALRDSVS
jgi:uncharacterized protein (TIGR02284 family)